MENEVLRQVLEALQYQERKNAERDAARAKENADLRVELEKSRTETAERIGDLGNKIVIVSLGLSTVLVTAVGVAVAILVNFGV